MRHPGEFRSLLLHGKPMARQPTSPRCPSAPNAPSNPSSTLYDGPMPAAVAASAAPMERCPDRHRKITGRSDPEESAVMPASFNWSTKLSLRAPVGWLTHSISAACLPREDTSGTPTYFHSASVRTSTSTRRGFRGAAPRLAPASDRLRNSRSPCFHKTAVSA